MRDRLSAFSGNVPENPGFCKCCGRSGEDANIVADHCHDSMLFRGWICQSCNIGIGRFGDTPDGLNEVLAYLLKQYHYRSVDTPDGLGGKAKLFRIRYHLAKEYPKPEDNRCHICHRDDRRLVLDHNHDNDQFRGWLCDGCNVGIANLGDNEAGVKRAIFYLENHENSTLV